MNSAAGVARSWLVWAVGLCFAAGCGSHLAVSPATDAGPDVAGPDDASPDVGLVSAHLTLAIAFGQTDQFGPIPTNATAYRTCTLSNVGTGPTTLTGISFQAGTSADFAVQSMECPVFPGIDLAAGASCTFMIGFSPSAGAPETGTVVVTGANGDMPSLTFTGSGTTPVTITEYPIPTANSGPWTIAAGSDGALWFTENEQHQIGRITTSAAFTEYPTPIANGLLSVAPGPDGALWYVDTDNNQVVRLAMDGTMSTHPAPTLNDPQGIALGPDGALWVAAYGGKVGRVTTAGVVTGTFAIPTLNAGAGSITAGPAQTLWFTEYDAGQIARVELDGAITEFPIPAPPQGPIAITAGPDGQLWFVDSSQVGTVTSLGAVALIPAPNAGGAGSVITTGPDGALWFTEPAGNRIGRVDTSGDVFELRLPTTNAQPSGLAVGADGALWFTEVSANQIGRLAPGSP